MGGFILKVTKGYQYQIKNYGTPLPKCLNPSATALSCKIGIAFDFINEYPILYDQNLGYYIDLPDGISIDFIEIDGIRYSISSSPFPGNNQFWFGSYVLPPAIQEKICIDLV